MKPFHQILIENKIQKSIAAGIYKAVFDQAHLCKDPDKSFQCHCSVLWVENHLIDMWWHKDLKFITWDERRWPEIAEKLSDPPKFRSKAINELTEDIADFSVNGHSTIKFQGYYIDPYLKSKRVPEKEIQKFGKFWEKIIK
jgi:hypothetical protein